MKRTSGEMQEAAVVKGTDGDNARGGEGVGDCPIRAQLVTGMTQ